MESPWGTTSEDTAYNGARQGIAVDDLTARQPQHQAAGGSRSSLGLFIERSTSAPPSSSAACPVIGKPSHTNADSLVGSDLLEHMSRGVNSHASTPSIGNGTVRTERNEEDASASTSFLGRDDSTGRSTASTTSSFLQSGFMTMGPLSRPLSASGPSVTAAASLEQASFGDYGEGLVRSQSAAPSFSQIASPPGLSNISPASSASPQPNSYSNVPLPAAVRQRSASTGLIGSAPALRPAAKTLMDLIQEEYPDNDLQNNELPSERSTAINSIGRRSASPSIPQQHRHIATNIGTTQQLLQQKELELNELRNLSLETPTTVATAIEAFSQRDKGGKEHQEHDQVLIQESYARSRHELTIQGQAHQDQPHYQQQQLPRSQQQPVMTHYIANQSIPGGEVQRTAASIYAPAHPPQQALHSQLSPPRTQQVVHSHLSPSHQSQQGVHPQSSPRHPQQLMMDTHSQQVCYGGQQRVPVEVQPQYLQAQILPNGQTVYMNAAAPPQVPYGYATVQHHPHQPQIIHQQHASIHNGRGEQQYVSVVPMQGGGPQPLTYWQSDGTVPGQVIATPTVAIVNAPGPGGGTNPYAVTQLGNVPSSAAVAVGLEGASQGGTGQGRHREKSGRGRRGGGNSRRNGTDTKHSASNSTPSTLLEEFQSSKNRDVTIHQIEGHVVEFCQDQKGSRFIQQRLEMGDVTEQEIVMKEMLPEIRRLRNDVFGNYVVQKLLEFGKPKIKAEIRETLEGEMLQLSLQMYGCRVVQKALEALDENELPRILAEFHHNVLSCIHDQNGNHVIQKCIEVLSSRSKKALVAGDTFKASFLNEQIDFIVDDVLVNVVTLSCHPYGCRVLQRILEHCEDKRKTVVLDKIKNFHRKLLDDQYGNYVIQHVLQYGRSCDRDSILEIVVSCGLLRLSRQKFASNVVEKLLKYGNGSQTKAIVREMLKLADDVSSPGHSLPGDAGSTIVLLMVRDAYANYVVQTTLDVIPESEEKRLLLKELNSHCEELRNYTFAKHIVTKLAALNNGEND